MESPIRRYQRTKDYQRHKLFRKMKRRRNAQIESVKDAPVRKLRRKLGIPKFAEGVRNLRFVGNDGRIVDDLGDDMLVLHDAEDGYGDDPSKWVYINDRTGETYTPYVPTDNGTIQQKGRWSALNRLEALSNPYRTNPVLGAPARLIGALKDNNAIDMSIFDVIGAVAPFVGASTLKFSKPLTQQNMRNMTLRQLGEYFEANPHLLKDIEVTLNVRNFYNNDVLPRLAKQVKKPVGFTADDLINQLKFKAGNFGESNYGGYYSSGDNSIILNDKYLNNQRMLDRILMHEISHGMYNRAGYTPEAASKLQAAYRFSPEYLAAHPEIQQLAEQSAVNTETRGMLSMDNGWLFGKPLDNIIKNIDNRSLMKYYTGNGASTYAKDWSKQFLPGMMLLKGALTGVAGTIPFILSKDSIGYKNGKLPYKDGKPVVLNNYTNAKFNDDGTFTDDTTRVFDDFYVTPSGVKTKYGSYTDKNWDRYKQQETFFRTHDQQTGNLKYEPGLEIVSPEFDLLTGIRGIYQTLKPASKLLQKSLNDVNNIGDIAKEPYMKTSADIAKESSTIRELNRVNKMLREFSDDDSRISNAYNNIKTFLQSPAYKKRLEKYYRDKGSSIITQNIAPGDRIGELLYNIETSKLKIMPRGKLIDEVGDVKDSFGLYDPNSHSIQIASDAIRRLTPEHEMWHASRKARTYLDNEKYKMRVRSLSDPVYYGNMSELEVRILDTLREMQEAGLDINNLTDDQIWDFLKEVPIDTHGTNVQSLIDNYWYDDIKNALRNFKTVIYPLGFGGVGYGSYNKYAE